MPRAVITNWQAKMTPFFLALRSRGPDRAFLLLEEVFYLD